MSETANVCHGDDVRTRRRRWRCRRENASDDDDVASRATGTENVGDRGGRENVTGIAASLETPVVTTELLLLYR